MAWKTAQGDMTPTWQQKGKDLNVGDSVEGVLTEKKSGLGSRGNSNLYIVEQKGGDKIGVWGSVILDTRLSDKKIGTLLKITYQGKKKGKNGQEYNDFLVEYDDDLVKDVEETFK